MSNNIIDKIQLSGVTYDIGGQGGSGVSVVEITQSDYDNLPSSAKTDTSKMYVITDAEAGDLTNYYTKTETNTLLGGKQATLVSGTNIKTINNESILGSGNIDIQGSGGKAVTGGTNISVTTGETADTINCTLNISNGTGTKSIKIGDGVTASGNLSFAQGDDANASGNWSTAFGRGKSTQNYAFSANSGKANRSFSSAFGASIANNTYGFATGAGSNANGHSSFVSGWYTNSNNNYEAAFGNYNNSVSASTTFGDSGNTLFSVGNGTSNSARHNAFEIRQNGDIYLTKDGQDVKLQDQLGGSSYTAGDGIDITNDVISVTGKVDTSAFTAHTADTVIHVTSAEKATWNAKSDFSGSYNDLTDKPTIPTVPTSNTAFTNDAGYITSSALNGYATTGDVQTATNDMATKTWVNNQGYLTEHQSLSDYYTKSETDDLLDTKLDVTAYTPTDLSNYYTKSETSGSTQISTALASKADTATTYTKTEVDTALASKQTTLTAGTNITIVDNVISATGGGGGGVTIDPTLDSGSTNPVANSAITEAVLVPSYRGLIEVEDDVAFPNATALYVEKNGSRDSCYIQASLSGESSVEDYIFIESFTAHTFQQEPSYVDYQWVDDALILTPKASGNYFYKASDVWGNLKLSTIDNYSSGSSSSVIQNEIYPRISEIKVELNNKTDTVTTDINFDPAYNDYGGYWRYDLRWKNSNMINYTYYINKLRYNDFGYDNDGIIFVKKTSGATSGSTDCITSGGVYEQMGGMKIVKLTQSAYDALSPNYDSNTLYVIVN